MVSLRAEVVGGSGAQARSRAFQKDKEKDSIGDVVQVV